MKCPHCGKEIDPPDEDATEAQDFTTGGEYVALVEKAGEIELVEFSPLV